MNAVDGFESILPSRQRGTRDDGRRPAAAVIEEACGAVGICFPKLLYRGEFRDDLAREHCEVYHSHDEAPPRRRELPDGGLVHAPELYTERELKTACAQCNVVVRESGGFGWVCRHLHRGQ